MYYDRSKLQTCRFAGSRHRQCTSVSLADGAALLWWEVLAPGRPAMGETFAFDRLRIQTELRSACRPLLIENLVLEPAKRPLHRPPGSARIKRKLVLVTVVLGSPVDSVTLWQRIS